ncbi:hypothetical protein B0H67DRAFT_577640 [Lasiosphaeris hirsuta]|uniref:Essential protein Yae1 N-terminal domain-containing protein n=1 Tax=Lasiosphaeris hirsuta TaxID=260670 RepID=A0AA40E1L5_9PEZI|nr:hypothetical protein B0H67DRAFT_577640 [Lasiosphaeris hirsuta]
MAAHDPFEDILNLEEQFYQDGFKQGQQDGFQAGRSEGRSLGLEKGYLKFLESGKLYGRSIVWASRLPSAVKSTEEKTKNAEPIQGGHDETTTHATIHNQKDWQQQQLPILPNNARLEKHITTLYALVETESLSTENTDEAVNDFDDRLKRAQGKAKIIERLVGEIPAKGSKQESSGTGLGKKGVEDI